MIVRLKPKAKHQHLLTKGQLYYVIGIESDYLRLLDDHGEPTLHDPSLFEMVDATEPNAWISKMGRDGERYAYPRGLGRVGFFEAYFDRNQSARTQFWRIINRVLSDSLQPALTAKARPKKSNQWSLPA